MYSAYGYIMLQKHYYP